MSAVLIGSPGLAAGNIFGANMLNVSNLAIVVALVGARRVFQQIMEQQAFLLGLAIVLTGMATLFAATQLDVKWGFIGPTSLMILGVYGAGSWYLYRSSTRAQRREIASEPDTTTGATGRSLGWAVAVFTLCAVAIFAAAPVLATSADRFAELTGIAQSFVGVLAVAIVTTLPELTASITAVRIKAYDLAVSGIYGSNALNVAALGIADLFSSPRSLFGELDSSHITAGIAAVVLMGLGLVQLLQRKPVAHFALTRPSTGLIVAIYVLGLFLVLRLG